MSRVRDEVVDVRRRDEVPTQFVWRGRLHVVREVLACWVEAGRWWEAASADPSGAAPAPARVDDGERECWRVLAAAGRSGTPGVYDLSLGWSGWRLVRVHD